MCSSDLTPPPAQPPENPEPAPAQPPADQPPPPAQPKAAPPPAQPPAEPPPAQPQEPEFSTQPTTADTLRSMFSRQQVQPAEAQPPVEVPPDVPIAEPENMDEKARNAWVESRNREKQLRQYLAQQKRQIEEFAGKQEEFQKERDDLAKALKERDDQLKAANEKLGKLDLSGSVEFRKRYDQPLQQAEANLDTLIHDTIEGADTPEQIAKIRQYMLGDDSRFSEYISGLDIDTQGKLIEKRRTFIELAAQREQALKDWQTTARGLTDAAARENAAERAIARQRAAENAVRRNTTELPANLRPYVTTDEAFADEVKTANDAFSAFMATATDEEMAAAAHLGHFIPAMNRALMMAIGRAQQAEEELLRMRGIRNIPTRSAPPAPPPPAPPAPRTPENLEAKAMQGIEDALAPLMGGPAVPRV